MDFYHSPVAVWVNSAPQPKHWGPRAHRGTLCEENPLVSSGFPIQRASNVESISLSWYHHAVARHIPLFSIHFKYFVLMTKICVVFGAANATVYPSGGCVALWGSPYLTGWLSASYGNHIQYRSWVFTGRGILLGRYSLWAHWWNITMRIVKDRNK